jgi:hypothetical protein
MPVLALEELGLLDEPSTAEFWFLPLSMSSVPSEEHDRVSATDVAMAAAKARMRVLMRDSYRLNKVMQW